MKTVYQTDDGEIFDTAEKAQAHEMHTTVLTGALQAASVREAVDWIFLNYVLTKRKRGMAPLFPPPYPPGPPVPTGWPKN